MTIIGVPDRPGDEPGDILEDRRPGDRGGHDRAERRGRRHCRHFLHCRSRGAAGDAQGRRASGQGAGGRGRLARRRRGEGLDRGAGDGQANRRGPADVPRLGRCRHQHSDDQHQRNQNLGPGRPAARARRRCARCIRPLPWRRRRSRRSIRTSTAWTWAVRPPGTRRSAIRRQPTVERRSGRCRSLAADGRTSRRRYRDSTCRRGG